MSDKYNCPNCGAPIGYTERCAYCGTVLNWIPTVHVVYETAVYTKRVLQAQACVPVEDVEHIGEVNILARMAREMATQLPKVWELRCDDDPFTRERVYRARLSVNERVR